MKKILITGGSGFLAKRVGDYIAEDPGMIVLLPTHSELDITSKDNCRKWFEDNMPDMVIHLAAISDITECEKNEGLSRSVNIQGPLNLADCFREFGCTGRFIYASSDQVYTANRTADRLNKETDTLAPVNLYGREKLEAEERVSSVLPESIAVRMDWMFDLRPGKMNYLKNLILSVKEQIPTKHALNELRAETYAYEVAVNMKTLVLCDASGGAYNFGGPAYGNSYDTAKAVYELLGEYMKMPVRDLAVPVRYESARSLAMDQSKLNSIGISFRNTVDSVRCCLEREAGDVHSFLRENGGAAWT